MRPVTSPTPHRRCRCRTRADIAPVTWARVRHVPAVVEIAELLGVTKQRAHQLAAEPGFTAPLAEDGWGRLWGRGEV